MAVLYVMNVAEFAPLATAAQAAGATVRSVGDYLEVTSPSGRLVLEREHARVRPAIWFAALTGGFVGSVIRFDDYVLCLDDVDQ